MQTGAIDHSYTLVSSITPSIEMRAYLDFNVIVSIHKGEITIPEIQQIDDRINEFPFSASHVQEADNIAHSDKSIREAFIEAHLETISHISKNSYLYQNPDNQVFLLNERPQDVLKTVKEVPGAKDAIHGFVNLVSADQKADIRKMLGIDPREINNYTPEKVIDHLNSALTGWGLTGSFLDLIEKAISMNPHGHTFGRSERFAAIYDLLDMLGYWKDKQTKTSNAARFWDSSHAFFASHCEYFISDDLRTRNKAKVVYYIYGIGTNIVSSSGQR